MSIKKVTHLTSVHPRFDTRVFYRNCKALSDYGYDVNLIVADGKGEEYVEGVQVFDVGTPQGRLNRVLNSTKKVYHKALELDSDVYHFHDPELIPVGIKLKKQGYKVIFDIHENIGLQIKEKVYLNYFTRNIFAFLYQKYEKYTLNKFDYLILAENSYLEYYSKLSSATKVILNMPDVHSLMPYQVEERHENGVFYIGGVSNERGLDVTLEAIKIVKQEIPDIYMHYVGRSYDSILDTLELDNIKDNIKFYGAMPLYAGLTLSKRSKVGLAILKPLRNYTESYSTKVFEYMALGLPVVTSNFQLYKDVVEKYDCGICVDPLNPSEIAEAIKYIIRNPQKAMEMGENGKKIIFEKYNWAIEQQKLYDLYHKVLQ